MLNGPIWSWMIFFFVFCYSHRGLNVGIDIRWQAPHWLCILTAARPQSAGQFPNSGLNAALACFEVKAVKRSSSKMSCDDRSSDGWSVHRGAHVALTFLPDYPHSPSSSFGSLGRIVCSVSSAGSSSELALPTSRGVKTETGHGGKSAKTELKMAAWMLERFRPWKYPLTLKLKAVPWTEAVDWVTSRLL